MNILVFVLSSQVKSRIQTEAGQKSILLQTELTYRADEIGECRAKRNGFNFLSLNH